MTASTALVVSASSAAVESAPTESDVRKHDAVLPPAVDARPEDGLASNPSAFPRLESRAQLAPHAQGGAAHLEGVLGIRARTSSASSEPCTLSVTAER